DGSRRGFARLMLVHLVLVRLVLVRAVLVRVAGRLGVRVRSGVRVALRDQVAGFVRRRDLVTVRDGACRLVVGAPDPFGDPFRRGIVAGEVRLVGVHRRLRAVCGGGAAAGGNDHGACGIGVVPEALGAGRQDRGPVV